MNACQKETTQTLAQQHIRITGPGTTYYSDKDYLELVALSDTSKIFTITELKHSMNSLTAILNKYHDRAGSFPTLYNVVTDVAYTSLINSTSPFAPEGRAFMNEFAKHYVRNLHAYLLGKDIEPAWLNYYQRVAENKNTFLHLAMSGINAHITYDIPFVLLNIQAQADFEQDFKDYTDFIAGTYPAAADELEAQFGIQNADEVFQLFGIGEAIDAMNGEGFTTHLIVDMLRTESWNRGMILVKGNLNETQMHHICFKSFAERETILQTADDARLLF